jgi:hypothetical protein
MGLMDVKELGSRPLIARAGEPEARRESGCLPPRAPPEPAGLSQVLLAQCVS